MKTKKILDKNSRVLVATFSPWKDGVRSPTNGMVDPFVKFFTAKVNNFALIDQPHPGSDIFLPRIEIYEKKKLSKIEKGSLLVSWTLPILWLTNKAVTQISFKIRDFLSIIDFVLFGNNKYDLFVGFESINALAGVVMRMFGKIDTVIYYVSDFSPKRYEQSWFNSLYLFLDKLATKYSDATWNVSPAMPKARKKLGYDMKKMSKQVFAPNAFFKHQIKYNPISRVNPHGVVYAGTMGPENGPDLAIEAMPAALKKFPKTILTMIGGGNIDHLKDLAKKLKIEKSVDFRGFVPTNKEMYEIIRTNAVSIAPYRSTKYSVRWYADAVKIRTSLACGVPVLTTQVPPNGKLVTDAGAGIVTRDNPKALSKALIGVFSDKKGYLKMRNNAIKAAKENTWEHSYTNALRQMNIILN